MQYGAKGDGVSDDTAAIKNAFANAYKSDGTVHLPAGKYVVTSPIVISGSVSVTGEAGTQIVSRGSITAMIVSASVVSIEGIDFLSETANPNAAYFGLLAGNKGSDGKYSYLQNVFVRNCTFTNYTTSLGFEGVYWVQVSDVHTFNDKYGVVVNKDTAVANGIDALPATTLLFERNYYHGSDGAAQIKGSVGFSGWGIVNLTLTGCVIEWYEQAGQFYTCQLITATDLYLERCSVRGILFSNITGNVLLADPYVNAVAGTSFYWEYARLVLIGGRAALTAGQTLLEKGPSSYWTEVMPAAVSGGGAYLKANGYDGEQSVRLGGYGPVEKTVQASSDPAVRVRYQNARMLDLTWEGLTRSETGQSIAMKLGSVVSGMFTTSGLEFDASTKGVVLRSPNGTRYKLTVSNDGKPVFTKV